MNWLEAERQGVRQIVPRLYQRGHFLTWPYERKRQMMHDLRIDLVINLWLKADPDLSGMNYINMPMHGDAVPLNADLVARMAADWIGGGVLVHCEAGVNRSAWFCARILMSRGLSGEEAYAAVMEAVPKARIHTALKGDLMRSAA